MANFFPCPNPACTYQFDADQLPEAAMVTCPICRTRFPYRAAAAAPAPTREEARDEAWEGEPSAEPAQPRERPNRLVNSHYVPKSNRTQSTMMVVGFTLVSLTIIAVVMFTMKRHTWFGKDENSGPKYEDKIFNFRFNNFNKEKWREDNEMAGKYGTNGFFFKHQEKDSDPDAWIALRCVMFGNNGERGPHEGELEKEVARVLGKFNIAEKVQSKAKIGEQAASGYTFNGSMQDAAIWGEIYGFQNRGIGYVLAIWATEAKWKTAQEELAKMRDSFEFANQRDKWTNVGGQSKFFFVDNGDYQLEDTFNLWQRANPDAKDGDRLAFPGDPKDEDDNATMLFRCLHPEDRKARLSDRRYVYAYVVVLPRVGDSAAELKQYVFDTLKKKEGDKIKFKTYDKLPFDYKMPSSAATITTYKLTHPADRDFKFFYVIAAKKVNGQTVAVVGRCKEAISDVMGPHILRFAASLKDRQ